MESAAAAANSIYPVYETNFKICGKNKKNTTYQCPECDKVIICTGYTRLKCHIVGQIIGNQNCSACPRPNKISRAAIKLEIFQENAAASADKKRKLESTQQTLNLQLIPTKLIKPY